LASGGRDSALRELAANRGLKLVRSRRRTPGKGDYGRYGLTDAAGAKLIGFGRSGLTATAAEIEAYLHEGSAAGWKTSLRAAGGKAPARSKKRNAPDPEPEPEPKPLAVRAARPADAAAIAKLVAGASASRQRPQRSRPGCRVSGRSRLSSPSKAR